MSQAAWSFTRTFPFHFKDYQSKETFYALRLMFPIGINFFTSLSKFSFFHHLIEMCVVIFSIAVNPKKPSFISWKWLLLN